MQAASALTPPPAQPYPVRLSVEYPERLSRLSTFFRLILVIPVFLFLYLLQANVVAAMWAAVLVRGRIPHWLFDFQVGLNRFVTRTFAYFALLTDQYPAFEGDWVVQYDVAYPERISRWRLLFWKIITGIPHLFVLLFLNVAASFCVFIAWWAILFTGRFPRGLHTFVVGVMRWGARVNAYIESLTDVFPPYSLDADAGPGGSQAISAVIGGVLFVLVIAGIAGGATAVYVISNKAETVQVNYDDAVAGTLSPGDAAIELDNVMFELIEIDDDATTDILAARGGYRLVAVTATYTDLRRGENPAHDLDGSTLRLVTADDGTISPVLLTVDGVSVERRRDVGSGDTVELRAYFEVRTGDTAEELRGYTTTASGRRVVWEFE